MRSFWSLLAVAALMAAPVMAEEQELEFVAEGPHAVFGFAAAAPMPEYWLGVHCLPADDTLKSHLDLKQGLVVHGVVPEGPAAKAGIKQHDVLLTADGKELTDPAQLTQLIGDAKDKSVAIELIRAGKKQSVNATPAKRPEGGFGGFNVAAPQFGGFGGKLEPEVQEFFQKFAPLPGQDGVRMRIMQPGIVTPAAIAEMPKDLTIQVTRTGNEPAKIVVKKGDKTWEVTEKELDKLPPELRPHVARLSTGGDVIRWTAAAPAFGGGGGVITVAPVPMPNAVPFPQPAVPQFHAVPPIAGQRVEVRAFGGPAVQDLEKKMKDLQERVESLEKQLKK